MKHVGFAPDVRPSIWKTTPPWIIGWKGETPQTSQLGGNKKNAWDQRWGSTLTPAVRPWEKTWFFAPKFVWAKMMFDWTSGVEHWVKKGLAELGELPMFSHVHLFFNIHIYICVIVGYTVVPHSCPTIENSIS